MVRKPPFAQLKIEVPLNGNRIDPNHNLVTLILQSQTTRETYTGSTLDHAAYHIIEFANGTNSLPIFLTNSTPAPINVTPQAIELLLDGYYVSFKEHKQNPFTLEDVNELSKQLPRTNLRRDIMNYLLLHLGEQRFK